MTSPFFLIIFIISLLTATANADLEEYVEGKKFN